ncbi:DHH family phosphoesterase, partial [Candidatus Peregrinibacteria bacterium]|nr:DHH family phosphoesterase [Candidatus Peregrinibacteria bacterium]
MKLIVIGRGHRVTDIIDSFSSKSEKPIVITDESALHEEITPKVKRAYLADLSAFSMDDLGVNVEEHIFIVTHYEEKALIEILENLLKRQDVKATITVFASLNVSKIKKIFPQVHFKNDRDVYEDGLADVIKEAETKRKFNQLLHALGKTPKIACIIYGNPDPDALASAYALKALLKKDNGSFLITYTGEFTRPENLAMVEALNIHAEKFQPSFIDDSFSIVTVDAQPSFFSQEPNIDGTLKFDAVIDHHPRTTAIGKIPFIDIRPSYGATSSIITEYFSTLGEKMSKDVATALLYGLKIDTQNLKRLANDADINAYKYLMQRADHNIIHKIELSQLPINTLDYFGVALLKKKVYDDLIFSYLGRVDNPDVCVHIADFYLRLEGIGWVVVGCTSAEKLVVVFRSDGFRKDAGKLAEALFGELGSAGGH